VIKLRGQKHDRAIREYDITDRGIRILEPFTGIGGILSGQASSIGDRGPTRLP
jgi:circadian clock protein KaiC